MSAAATGKVWERSKARGTELLVLLAVADYAHDDGRDAWPTIETLATKSRLSVRAVWDILRRLQVAGELEVEKNADGRRVRGGHRPRQFLHVLCCAPPAEGSPPEHADPAGLGRRRNRKELQDQHADPAGSQPADSACSTCSPTYDEPADSRTPNKEDPLRIRQEHTQGVRAHPLDEPRRLEPWAVELFEELWALYPRKDARVAGMRAWHTLAPTRELAGFILAHVRTRLALGWGATPVRFLPQLRTFLDERRWQERYVPEARAPAAASQQLPDGMLVMRLCSSCGAEQEGRVVKGEKVFGVCGCAQEGRVEAQT
jgi:hypothetical protein